MHCTSAPFSILILTVTAFAIHQRAAAAAVTRNAPELPENRVTDSALRVGVETNITRDRQAPEAIRPRTNERSLEWRSKSNNDGEGGDSTAQLQNRRNKPDHGRKGKSSFAPSQQWRNEATIPSGEGNKGYSLINEGRNSVDAGTTRGTVLAASNGDREWRQQQERRAKAETSRTEDARGAGEFAPGPAKKKKAPSFSSFSDLGSEGRSFRASPQGKEGTTLPPSSVRDESNRRSIDPRNATAVQRGGVDGKGKEGGELSGGTRGGDEENTTPLHSPLPLNLWHRSLLRTSLVFRQARPAFARLRSAPRLLRDDGSGGGGHGRSYSGRDSQNGKPWWSLQNSPSSSSSMSLSSSQGSKSILFRPQSVWEDWEGRGARTDQRTKPQSPADSRSSRRTGASYGRMVAQLHIAAQGQIVGESDKLRVPDFAGNNGYDPAQISEVPLPSAVFSLSHPPPSEYRLRFDVPGRAFFPSFLDPARGKTPTGRVLHLQDDTKRKDMSTLGNSDRRGANLVGRKRKGHRLKRDANNDNIVIAASEVAGSGFSEVDTAGGEAKGEKLTTAALTGGEGSFQDSFAGGSAVASDTGLSLAGDTASATRSVTQTTADTTSPLSSSTASLWSSSLSSISSSSSVSSSSSPPDPALTSFAGATYEGTSPGKTAIHSTPTSSTWISAVSPSSSPPLNSTTSSSTSTTSSSKTTQTNNSPHPTSLGGMTSLTTPSLLPNSHAGVTSTVTSASSSAKSDVIFTPAGTRGPHTTSQAFATQSPADGASVSSTRTADSNTSITQNIKSSEDAQTRQTPSTKPALKDRANTETMTGRSWTTKTSKDLMTSKKTFTSSGDLWTSGENSVSPTVSSTSIKRTLRSTDAETSGTPTQPGVEGHQEAASTTSSAGTTTAGSTTSPAVPKAIHPAVASPASSTSGDKSGLLDGTGHISGETSVATSTVTPSQTHVISSDPEVNSTADVTPEVNPTADVTPEMNSTADVTPEVNSTSDVTTNDFFGSAWTSGPEPYPEGEPYPEPGDKVPGVDEKEGDEEAVAEPGPDWPVAKSLWKEAWELHLYVFGGLFGGLGVYILVCVLRLWRSHRLLSRRYFVSLNLLMLLLCLTRSLYLTMDGYNSRGTFHPSLDYFLYSISFPCLTSAFSIQLYALLQATRMQFLPPTIQKMSLLMTIVGVHFAISITTDVVVGLYAGMEIMLFVCQLFFVFWGLFLFFGYAYIFRRLYVHAVKRQKNASVSVYNNATIASGSAAGSGGNLVKPKRKFTLSVAVTVTMLTAVLGLVTVGLELYGLVGVYKTFSADRPEPWPWYIYHTSLRLVEFLMCATMGYVASQPFRYRRDRGRCCCPVLCAPCAEICYCGHDVTRSEPQAGWSEIDQHQMRSSFDRASHLHHHHHGNGHAALSAGDGEKGLGEEGGDEAVTTKTRIYFSDHDDVIKPVVTSQPGFKRGVDEDEEEEDREGDEGEDESNTLSTRGSLSGGSGSYQGSGGLNSPNPGGRRQQQSPSSNNNNNNPAKIGTAHNDKSTQQRPVPAARTTLTQPPPPPRAFLNNTTWNGVVNTGYVPANSDSDDSRPARAGSPVTPQSPSGTGVAASAAAAAAAGEAGDSKSRKGSGASSEFFLGPQSVSLADSMASELDKAFRSMHEDDEDAGDVFLQQDRRASASSPLQLEERRAVEHERAENSSSPPAAALNEEWRRRSNSHSGLCSFAEEGSRRDEERKVEETQCAGTRVREVGRFRESREEGGIGDGGNGARADCDNGHSSTDRKPAGTHNGGGGSCLSPSAGDSSAAVINSPVGHCATSTNIPVDDDDDASARSPPVLSDVSAAHVDVSTPNTTASPARARAKAAVPYCTVIPITADKSRGSGRSGADTPAPGSHYHGQQTTSPKTLPQTATPVNAGLTGSAASNAVATPTLPSSADQRPGSAVNTDTDKILSSAGSPPAPPPNPASRGFSSSSPASSSNGPLAPRGSGALGTGSVVTRPLSKGLLGYGLDDGDDIEV